MEIWQLDPAVYAGRKFTARYRTKGYYDICAAEDGFRLRYVPLTGRFVNADVYCDTYTGNPLSTNMFVYCENDAINYVDNDGRRTYFLNGINNNSKNGITWYASALKNKLSKYVKDVRIIAIYKSKENGVRSTIKGVAQVFLEMMNVDVYTNSVVNIIKKT